MAATLAQALKEQNEAARARIPPGTLAVMEAATASLEASQLAERSLAVGAAAPDFSLPDAKGDRVVLSKLLTEGQVVLSFYRGGWCPYCNIQLKTLQDRLGDIAEAGGRLVAVSPQTPDNSLSTAEKHSLAFPVLSDVGNAVARSYGIVFTLADELRPVYAGWGLDLAAANGDRSFELPLPATYLIRPDGTVAWRFVDADYTKRAEPDDVVDALRAL